jgi:hypothetical protein
LQDNFGFGFTKIRRQTVVMGVRGRIGSISSLHAMRAKNCMRNRTQKCTRVDGPFVCQISLYCL